MTAPRLDPHFFSQHAPLHNEMHKAPLTRPHRNCYWVLPGRFLAGEYPGAYRPTAAQARLQGYVQAGITAFIDLTHPNDGLAPYEDILYEVSKATHTPVTYHRLSIYDMSVPTHQGMVQILDTIDTVLAANTNLYVHCWGGIGRTGTVIGCHLVRHGSEGEAALRQIATWWQTVEKSVRNPRSPETDAQVAMIREWCE